MKLKLKKNNHISSPNVAITNTELSVTLLSKRISAMLYWKLDGHSTNVHTMLDISTYKALESEHRRSVVDIFFQFILLQFPKLPVYATPDEVLFKKKLPNSLPGKSLSYLPLYLLSQLKLRYHIHDCLLCNWQEIFHFCYTKIGFRCNNEDQLIVPNVTQCRCV